MKLAIAGMVWLLLLALSSGAEAQCLRPDAPTPKIHLDVEMPRLDYRHDVDLLGLRRLQRSLEMPSRGMLLGATVHGEGVKMNIHTEITQAKDGRRYCYWITEVAASVMERQLTVYVAANYPVGSCEYNVVLDHENQHVTLTKGVIAQWAPRLDQALRAAVARINPVASPLRDSGSDLKAFLVAAMKPSEDAFFADLRRANATIDTPENYRRTSALCNNWVPHSDRERGSAAAGRGGVGVLDGEGATR